MSRIFEILTIFVILLNNFNKFVVCLNASEINSFVLLHDRVKNTLIEIAINGRCDSPKPTVVYVNETNDKLYLPRATILYRCSDQFACCPNPRHTCLASVEEDVDIGFYTLTKTEDQITERSIEVLKFKNHTKCGCRRKGSQLSKESKDILLVSDSKKQEFQTNSTSIVTKTTEKVSPKESKTPTISTFIEKHLKTDNKTKISNEGKPNNSSVTTKTKNFVNSTQKPFKTSIKSVVNSRSQTTVPIIRTTKPTFVTKEGSSISSSLVITTKPKTTELKVKTTSDKPKITTMETKRRKSKQTTKAIPIVTTIRPLIHTKVKESEKNLNSLTTPDLVKDKTTEKAAQTTPQSTILVRSKGTFIPLISSSINYDELEREEDLKPEEDVIYNNGNAFDLFYTNGIFFRPLTTTPFRSHRSVERVTPKCG